MSERLLQITTHSQNDHVLPTDGPPPFPSSCVPEEEGRVFMSDVAVLAGANVLSYANVYGLSMLTVLV